MNPTRRPAPLPKLAQDFLSMLALTLKPGTRKNYRDSLLYFHRFLSQRRLSLTSLTRNDIVKWLTELSERNLVAATRAARIINTRTYLNWLHQSGHLTADPNTLIFPSDIPRRPTYLPRPLPPDLDRELQQRLANSDNLLHKGLLLMRLTGIRIGELIALPFSCVEVDLHNHSSLKVPLGKLNNERLVPLTAQAASLIYELQALQPLPRSRLLHISSSNYTAYTKLRLSLKEITSDFSLPQPITTHRLRHSFATSLHSAGMSLEGVMRLLGHRDFNMTLRYADVTLKAIRKEFAQALINVEESYFPTQPGESHKFDPDRALADILAWLKKEFTNPTTLELKRILLMRRKLNRLRSDLQNLTLRS